MLIPISYLAAAALRCYPRRTSSTYRMEWTLPQLLSLFGAIAAGRLTEVLLKKHSKELDKKTCQFIGSSVTLFIVMISVLFLT